MLSVGQYDLSSMTLTAQSPVRDLNVFLDSIWQKHFSDIPRINEVQIAYSYPWKRRLGLIRLSLDNTISFIGINALLQHLSLPEHVLITTVAHELAHYAHGFGSPLPRLYQHPHANNVVNRELERRGLGELLRLCDEWIDKQWLAFYQLHHNLHPHDLRGAPKGITCPPVRMPLLCYEWSGIASTAHSPLVSQCFSFKRGEYPH